MQTSDYLAEVRGLYEARPYPPCDPQDEHRRLEQTWLDQLPLINHYCFGGRQRFGDGFRVLVAGGGTGDATVYLAEQLRNTGARIVHLDLSGASIAIARERARIRKLDNIDWLQDSLLNLPNLGLAPFDYINCVGVLHHLADPAAGLRALEAVRKPEGAIGLMVYGAIGRVGVYHMQEMLRLAGTGLPMDERIEQARDALDALRPSNWYRRAAELYGDRDTDAGIADSLLHPQDRAYTVPQLYDWLQDQGGYDLRFSDVGRGRFPYTPALALGTTPSSLADRVAALPLRQQQAFAELFMGDLTHHVLFLTRGERVAPYGDAAMVPFFFHEALDGATLAAMFAFKGGRPTVLQHPQLGLRAEVATAALTGPIFALVDGKRSFGEIFSRLRASLRASGLSNPPDDAALFAAFRPAYEVLNGIERLLLRAAAW